MVQVKWPAARINLGLDRSAGDQVMALRPEIIPGVRANRRFLGRAVRYLAPRRASGSSSISAPGCPARTTPHEVAQAAADSRIVYADYDPIVISHLRALSCSADPRVDAHAADLAQPATVLAPARQTGLINLDEPARLILAMVLHFHAPAPLATSSAPTPMSWSPARM